MAVECLNNRSVLFLCIFVLYFKFAYSGFNKEYAAPRLHYGLVKKTSESLIFADKLIYRIRIGRPSVYLGNYLLKTRSCCKIILRVKYLKK